MTNDILRRPIIEEWSITCDFPHSKDGGIFKKDKEFQQSMLKQVNLYHHDILVEIIKEIRRLDLGGE